MIKRRVTVRVTKKYVLIVETVFISISKKLIFSKVNIKYLLSVHTMKRFYTILGKKQR